MPRWVYTAFGVACVLAIIWLAIILLGKVS